MVAPVLASPPIRALSPHRDNRPRNLYQPPERPVTVVQARRGCAPPGVVAAADTAAVVDEPLAAMATAPSNPWLPPRPPLFAPLPPHFILLALVGRPSLQIVQEPYFPVSWCFVMVTNSQCPMFLGSSKHTIEC